MQFILTNENLYVYKNISACANIKLQVTTEKVVCVFMDSKTHF